MSFDGPQSLRSRRLRQAIRRGSIEGLVFAPRSFEHVLSRGQLDRRIRELTLAGQTAGAIYESLVVESVRSAADLLSALHPDTSGRHGYVSAAISPELCYDTDGLIEEAENLCSRVRRPNFMIGMPATHEALAAATQLLVWGFSIDLNHVTSETRYHEILSAYLAALAFRETAELPLSGILCAIRLEQPLDLAATPAGESFQRFAAKGALPPKILHPADRPSLAAEGDSTGEWLVEARAAACLADPLQPPLPGDDDRLDQQQNELISQDILCSDRIVGIIGSKSRCRYPVGQR